MKHATTYPIHEAQGFTVVKKAEHRERVFRKADGIVEDWSLFAFEFEREPGKSIMHHSQILGPVIRRLRAMALEGRAPAELWDFLDGQGIRSREAAEYLSVAFLQSSGEFFFTMSTRDATVGLDAQLRRLVLEKREEWENQRFPELMRLGDYIAFSRFAVEYSLTVMVCSANLAAGQYVGRPGFNCYAGSTPVISLLEGTHAGLLAAPPAEPRLVALLRALPGQPSYEEYVGRLRRQGYQVLEGNDGWLIVSEDGRPMYEGYRLHGVYDEHGESPWHGKDAERLRGVMNRYLGADLISGGPHDDWAFRDDSAVAGPLSGPQFPVVVFLPEGEIDNFLDAGDLVARWHLGADWRRRYPRSLRGTR